MSGHKKMDLTVAKRLNQIMSDRKLYPIDVSRLTGIKVRMIKYYVAGSSQPSAFMLKKLAVGLGVSSDWLLGIEK